MELNITDLNTIAMIDKMMEFEVVKEITSNNNEISLDGFKHNGSYSIIVSKLKWAKESKQYEYDVLMVIKPETWKILKGERFTFKVDINKDELPSTERDKYQWLSHKYVDFLDNVCISPIEWININQIEKRNSYNNSRLITIYSKEYNVIYDTVE